MIAFKPSSTTSISNNMTNINGTASNFCRGVREDKKREKGGRKVDDNDSWKRNK